MKGNIERKYFLFFVLGLFMFGSLFFISEVDSAWVGPTANPPNNNTPTPINTSSSDQNKDGNLSIGGVAVCLEDGTNCGAGGGGGGGGSSLWTESGSHVYRPAGNVGIGLNANPEYTLDVNRGGAPLTSLGWGKGLRIFGGNAAVWGALPNPLFFIAKNNEGAYFGMTPADDGSQPPIYSARVDQTTGDFIFKQKVGIGQSGSFTPNSQLDIVTPGGGNAEMNFKSGNSPHWAIYHDDPSDELRFWNTNNRFIYTPSGRFGIGTTDPQDEIHITGGGPTIRFEGKRATGGIAFNMIQSHFHNTTSGEQAQSSIFGTFGDLNTSPPSTSYAFIGVGETSAWNNATFKVSETGVGINIVSTNSPTEALDVNGNVRISGNNFLYLEGVSGEDWRIDPVYTNGGLSITRHNSGGIEMFLRDDGNVGIGKTDPNEKLDVAGKVRAQEFCIAADCIAAWPGGGGGGGGGQWQDGAEVGEIFYNAGNVGIGTSNPADLLHIRATTGTGGMRLDINTASPTDSATLDFANAGTVKAQLGYYPAGNFFYIHHADDASGNSSFYVTGSGNVGIGTSSPDASIHVEEIGNQPLAIFESPTTPSTDIFKIETGGGTNRFIMKSNGKIGIQTANPIGHLHVNSLDGSGLVLERDTGFVADTMATFSISSNGGPPGMRILMSGDNGGSWQDALFIGNDLTIGIGTEAPTERLEVNGKVKGTELCIGADCRAAWPAGGGGGGLWVQAGANIHYSAGNVGIGTSTPNSILHIEGTVNNSTTIGDKQRILLTNNSVTSSAGGEVVFGTGDSAVKRYAAVGTALIGNDLETGARGRIYFATKTNSADTTLTERLTVLNNGNVGIGTFTPSTNLDINGNIAVKGQMFVNTDDATSVIQIGDIAGGDGLRDLRLRAGDQDIVNISQNGNVGIATGGIDPAWRLSVIGTIQMGLTPSAAGIRLQTIGSTGDIVGINYDNNAFNDLTFRTTAAGPTLSITTAGNVGIGTTSPNFPLAVSNSNPILNLQDSDSTGIAHSGYVTYRDSSNTERGWVGFGSTGTDLISMYNLYPTGGISLGTAGLERIRIEAGGNVGIGTTTPAQKLDVNGSAIIQGALTDESGKPSFFVSVAIDDCGGSHPYLGCPAGYVEVGSWHTGPGICDGQNEGQGFENGVVDSGVMALCAAS